MKRIFALILTLLLLLSGCTAQRTESSSAVESKPPVSSTPESSAADEPTSEPTTAPTVSTDEMFTDRDCDPSYDESKSVLIDLNGDSISCSSKAVRINGTTAVLTEEGTYILSGTLNDGMIVVNADKKAKLQIVLKDASVNSETSAALYVLQADKVFVTLADGTKNALSNGGAFTAIDDNNIDGAVFSKDDLTFNGSGSLTVTSPAGHGIVGKDDLVFTGGSYQIESASHGVEANDSVRVTGAAFTIASGKDGIHAENDDDADLGFIYIADGTFTISAEGDGIDAGSTMEIRGGEFDIVSGGGSENAEQKTSDFWGGFGGRGGGDFSSNFGGGRGGNRGGNKGEKPGGIPGDGEIPDEMPGEVPGDGEKTNGTPPGNGTMPDGEMPGGGMPDGEPPEQPGGGFAELSDGSADDSSTSIKGIKASGDLKISGGTFTIDSADDAIHSNSSILFTGGIVQIKSGDDGFHADENLTVTDGEITITESYEGLEALHLEISGGTITLTATDDGLNAAGGTDESGFGGMRGGDNFGGFGGKGGMGGSSDGTILISGGVISITASGDGIDANGSLEITGGHITVTGPTQGDTATLDYDTTGVISGGTFIGTGASNMAQSFSDSTQGVIAVNAGSQSAGTQITLTDQAGNTILTHTPELPFQVVILSTPELTKGETYTLTIGGSSGTFEAE